MSRKGLVQRYSKRKTKAKVILVEAPVEEIGMLNAFIDGAGRLAINRTLRKGEGKVFVIATPDTFERTLETLRGLRKFVRDLKILKVMELESLEPFKI